MASIDVAGFSFSILPETAAWSYAMKIQSFDTYAGRVIQLLACNVENLSVEGYISPRYGARQTDMGGNVSDVAAQWIGMEEFEVAVKAIMAYHEQEKRPAHFSFAEVGWDGEVYLTGYTDVRYEPDIPAARYTLKFEVDSGFEDIAAAAGDEGLKNIPDGVGWVRNVYNTPNVNNWEKVKDAIGKIVDDAGTHDTSKPADFYTYLKEAFEGEGDDESSDDDKKGSGDKDSDFTDAPVAAVTNTINSKLVELGLVAKNAS